MELVRRIQKVTELECGDISAPHPLLSLIIQHASEGQLDCRNNRGLYVVCKLVYMIINYQYLLLFQILSFYYRLCQINNIVIS